MAKKIIGLLNLFDSPSLGSLTEKRTLGSTSFLGRFALMDFPLSNFTNSKIDEINLLVPNNFRSVAKHVGSLKTWVNNTKIARQNILINERSQTNLIANTDIRCLKENDWVLYEANADYVVIQPAHILSTVDLSDVVNKHIESNADITVVYTHVKNGDKTFRTSKVIMLDGKKIVDCYSNNGAEKEINVSMNTYVVSSKLMFEIIHNQSFLNMKSFSDIVSYIVHSKTLIVNGFEYIGYARAFESFNDFLEYSFELLNYDVAKTLFREEWPIYTVTHNSKPALYGINSCVKNSFIANGAIIDGTVENSIVSRNVKILKGARVTNSIILTRTIIEEGAVVNNAVVDKDSTIKAMATVSGFDEHPAYVEQGSEIR